MLQTVQPTAEAAPLQRAIAWHVITCEYPPYSGGVSDYTILLAEGLASIGDEVHIWCPALPANPPEIRGVQVHPAFGRFSPRDLRNAGRELDRFPGPRRLLIQWVPHGFGYKSLNLPFCLWLWRRSKHHRDHVDVMVHEPFLQFLPWRWRQNAAATVHRLMTLVLLGAAREVFLSTPTWERMLRPFDWGHKRAYQWLPLPCNVPIANDPVGIAAIRKQYSAGGLLLGHFGTFNPAITPMVTAVVPPLLSRFRSASLLLIGPGGQEYREQLILQCPDLDGRVHAVGQIDARDPRLSMHLGACDVLLQPYPDGITTRRTTIMAAMAHGIATVTTTGELTEPLWSKSGAVALAPAHDSDAFVESAREILENLEKRQALGANGREFYQRNFGIQHVVEVLRASGDRPAELSQ
jgi:glycosyltransferase involved in cell wall biosynthesis